MQVPIVQIDAFADVLFEGNPAAVMPLAEWPEDALLQRVAAENNLSETAFLVRTLPAGVVPPDAGRPSRHLRWFTPAVEVDLCGHATMAGAAYLLEDEHPDADRVQFWTRSGWLTVARGDGGELTMDLPAQMPVPAEPDPVVERALGVPVRGWWRATDLVCVVDDASTVRDLDPDLTVLRRLPVRGVAVTAAGVPGSGFDFVSRWFGGEVGIAEDPVTGSAHCTLATWWSDRLGRTDLRARQLSPCGGTVRCRVAGDRTLLSGRCRRYLEGTARLR